MSYAGHMKAPALWRFRVRGWILIGVMVAAATVSCAFAAWALNTRIDGIGDRLNRPENLEQSALLPNVEKFTRGDQQREIPELSVTITSCGGPLRVQLVPTTVHPETKPGYLWLYHDEPKEGSKWTAKQESKQTIAMITVKRDGQTVAQHAIGTDGYQLIPVTSIQCIDTPPAGKHRYSIHIRVTCGGGTCFVARSRLVV